MLSATSGSSSSRSTKRLQYVPPECLRQRLRRVRRQGHEAAVGPEAAVGDQGVDVRLPVQERAVGLDAQDDAY
jgi:hypothetical protein